MEAVKRIAIGMPITAAFLAVIAALLYFGKWWAFIAFGFCLMSWAVGYAVVSHRAVNRIKRGKP